MVTGFVSRRVMSQTVLFLFFLMLNTRNPWLYFLQKKKKKIDITQGYGFFFLNAKSVRTRLIIIAWVHSRTKTNVILKYIFIYFIYFRSVIRVSQFSFSTVVVTRKLILSVWLGDPKNTIKIFLIQIFFVFILYFLIARRLL